jgi:protein SCO1/2
MHPARLARLLLTALLACGVSSQESYDVAGRVEDLDAASSQITIAHEEIPGFMPAMTMSFDVAGAELLEGVRPGARVRFTLLRSATQLRITDLEVVEVGVGVSGVSRAGLEEAEVAPAFQLLDQNGNAFALADTAGTAVLLDFVFTRCPGPCPILTAAHAELQRRLPASIRERTHFVSISVDPEYDTPERLREYARRHGADPLGWSFLTGDPETVGAVVEAYRVGSTRLPDGSIDHVTVTFLIDPEGHIARRYFGLEHPPSEMLADLQDVLS